MQLLSYGKKQNFITIKEDKKNTKIHLVLVNTKNKPEDHTACYLKWFLPSDIVDEVESMLDLKSILHDESFCKTCLKFFNDNFNQHYEELELKKVFARNREQREQKKIE